MSENRVENNYENFVYKIPEYASKVKSGELSVDNAIDIILEQYNIASPPVNPWKIARGLGFTVLDADFKDDCVSGALIIKNDVPDILKEFNTGRAIILNRKDSFEKQSFTVGHEIGHFILHAEENKDFFEAYHISHTKKSDDMTKEEKEFKRQEDEADKFSAKLLMPEKMFIRAILEFDNKRDREILIKELAKKFRVEDEAIVYRLEELNIEF